MRPLLIALLLLAGGGAAEAGERSFGFIHVDGNGGISQSTRGKAVAVSGGTRRDRFDRWDRRDRWDRAAERRAYRPLERSNAGLHQRGAFLYVSRSVNPTDRPYIPALDDIAYGGSGTYTLDGGSGDNGGGYWQDTPAASFPSQPKIINIEAERLDRRPVGASGIEITQNGGAKIIRIAPGYRESRERQASIARPAEQPRATAGYLQPWSEAWMKHCIKAFASFDPELGTYADAKGKIRFCTAEE